MDLRGVRRSKGEQATFGQAFRAGHGEPMSRLK